MFVPPLSLTSIERSSHAPEHVDGQGTQNGIVNEPHGFHPKRLLEAHFRLGRVATVLQF